MVQILASESNLHDDALKEEDFTHHNNKKKSFFPPIYKTDFFFSKKHLGVFAVMGIEYLLSPLLDQDGSWDSGLQISHIPGVLVHGCH